MPAPRRARGDLQHLHAIAGRRFTGAFAGANRALDDAAALLGRVRLGALAVRVRLVHLLAPTPGFRSGLHQHPFLEATWIRAGGLDFSIGDALIPCRAGDVFVMPAGRRHGWRAEAQGAALCGLMLELEPGDAAGESAALALEAGCAAAGHRVGGGDDLGGAALALAAAAEAGAPAAVLAARLHLVVALLCERLGGLGAGGGRGAADPVRAAFAFMRQRLGQPVAAGEVAERAGVGQRQLNRLLAARGHGPIAAELRRLRLERAGELLRDRRLGLAQVARACGFAGADWFARAFRRQFGTTPTAWRKRG